MSQGPNVKKLIVHKMSLIMGPPGGGAGAVVANLVRPGNLAAVAREATEWVESAIATVKSAPDNPYATDEEIAGEILRQIDAKKAGVKP